LDRFADMILDRTIPKSALLLGWLGVFPFAMSCLASVAGSDWVAALAMRTLQVYAMIILSFMGGVHWGLGMVVSEGGQGQLLRCLALSTTPALAAFALSVLAPPAALVGLAIVFSALLAYDVAAARAGLAPRWYGALRIQLTAVVVLCLMVAAGFGRA
jgi:hypothetical protein